MSSVKTFPSHLRPTMMLQSLELVCGLVFIFLTVDVRSQSGSCDLNSYCITLERCRTLRDSPTAGVPCGPRRRIQRVCCPRSVPSPTVATTSMPAVPPPPRPVASAPVPPTPPRTPLAAQPPATGPECGRQRNLNNLSPLVIGGSNATEGAWPWLVAITMWERRFQTYTPYCTGFLIDNRHVVSAAHCFENPRVGLYQARIGRVNQTQAEMYPIARIVTHEGYVSGLYYDDIAILTLAMPVTDPNFNPICLPDERLRDVNLTALGATVAGWGRTSRRSYDMSIILQQLAYMPIVPNPNCNRIIRSVTGARNFEGTFPRGITRGLMCAGFSEGERDACGGDSGGPLMVSVNLTYYAIGIVSFGISCARPGVPGGYTRVSEYLDWIRANTQD